MSKFSTGDKFTIGSITGVVHETYASSDYYAVKFDGNRASYGGVIRTNRVSKDWLDSLAEPVEPPALEVLEAMEPGDMFTWVTENGQPYDKDAQQVFVLIKVEPYGDHPKRKVDVVDLASGRVRRGDIVYSSDKITKVIEE